MSSTGHFEFVQRRQTPDEFNDLGLFKSKVGMPFAVFKGPIVDNTGKEVLAAGAVADDAWKGSVNFYVRGIEGKVPAGK